LLAPWPCELVDTRNLRGENGEAGMGALPINYLVSAVVTLLVVVEPIGLVPIFLAVTRGLPTSIRRAVGRRASIIAAAILAGSALVGDWLLAQLGISLQAFRIAGGLLLFSIASEMVFGVRLERQSRTAEQAIEEDVGNIAAFPLAIPLMAGPGAITASVLLAGQAAGRVVYLAALLAAIAIVIGACFALFQISSRAGPWFSPTAISVLSRILGVLLAALAVQYVIDGIRAALTS
jgi:multiple antibiotic resistance protein